MVITHDAQQLPTVINTYNGFITETRDNNSG